MAMPLISSTSCMTGTGFMKWMPINFSGLLVAAASRVIEIDEVLVASSVSGGRARHSATKMLRLTSSFSVAASITRSQPARSSKRRQWRHRSW